MIKNLQELRWLPVLVSCVAVAASLLAGCMKDGEDMLLLPVQNDRIPATVLSAAELDSLSQYMDINEGNNPPNIAGIYEVSPVQLLYSTEGYYDNFYDFRMHVVSQNGRNLAVYRESQNAVTSDGIEAYVIGDGNLFTLYTIEKSVNIVDGWSCELTTIVSGRKTAEGIADFRYAILLRNKQDDEGRLVAPDSFRIFTDGDGLASVTTTTLP